MTDKALEAAAKALIDIDPCISGHHESHVALKLPYAKAAISAYLSALPGEAEVVGRDIFECANQLGGYVGPNTDDELARFLLRESNAAADLAHEIVRLRGGLQAMQARAEAAERERDEFEAKWIAADEGEKLNAEFLAAADKRTEAAEARVKELEENLTSAQLHVEQLSELLKIIREHWIDYDHVFSIAVHEADEWLKARTALKGGSNG